MRYVNVGFFRCLCSKVHCYGGITATSRCTCGRNLQTVQVTNHCTNGHTYEYKGGTSTGSMFECSTCGVYRDYRGITS